MIMHFNQILVISETRANEKRVALTPKTVSALSYKGYRILVEKNAGLNAGFSNIDYTKAGAEIFSLTSSGYPENTFIVRVLWDKEKQFLENSYFNKNTAMLGFLFPFIEDAHITKWQQLKLTTLSFDLFNSLSIHDSKNAQAAMSHIAGRLALQDALKHYQGKKPIKLTVIGAGAAGLSATFEALKNNIPVQVFSRKESHRASLEKNGAIYYVLPKKNQIDFIKNYLSETTIVITAARTPGKKAPILLDKKSLSLLPPNAIIIDLAVSNGGNVIGSKHDQIIHIENNVSIINVSGYPKSEPTTSSEIYAQCVACLLTEIMTPEGNMSFENDLVQEIWLTHKGKRRNSLYNSFEIK